MSESSAIPNYVYILIQIYQREMAIDTAKYTICLSFQLTFMFCDLIFNCISLFPNTRAGFLIIFIFQDLFLIVSITSILMSFFSTILFQAGLVGALARRLRAAGGVCAGYACVSVALHAAWLLAHRPPLHSTPLFLFLFTVQRCLSPWYYFFFKRTALRVSDPRFYEDVEWINRPLQSN